MTTEYLLEEQVRRVLGCMLPANRLVCEVELATGLRISDILRLQTEQIKPRFVIQEQKTGKRRLVTLKRCLRERLLAKAGKKYVFPGRNPARPRSRQAVWYDLKRAARAYRLPQNCGTHSMRKVFAVNLLDKYGDIEKVRRALNHESMSVTVIYACADKLMKQRASRRG